MTHPIRRLLTGLALIVCLGACVTNGPPGTMDARLIRDADGLIAPWLSTDAPGVAVGVSIAGEVVFARGAGLANLEHGLPIQPDSVFQVASVSKQFTAFAALLLVAEGKIELGGDIRTYLPELASHPRKVTVQHLLDHTSGLREVNTLAALAGWLADDIHTAEQKMRLIERQRGENFAPGAEVEYSNTGYLLLAQIVARVTGMSFQEFTRTRLFDPLGMTNTRFIVSRNELIAGRASSYYPTTDGFARVIDASESLGSSGLYTTAVDLLRWARHLNEKSLGGPLVHELMAQRVKAGNGEASTFAKGHERRAYNGLLTWSHGGRDAGYRSFLLRIPEHDFALSIASNRTDFDTAELAFSLVDAFLSEVSGYEVSPAKLWTPATTDTLQQLAGDYEIQPGAIMRFTAKDDGLHFKMLGSTQSQALRQSGLRMFDLNPASGLAVRFAQPVNGGSPSMEYVIGLHGTLKAQRIELASFDVAGVDIGELVGEYRSDEIATTYELQENAGALIAVHPRLTPFALIPLQTDLFVGREGPLPRVTFQRDDAGQIVGFLVSGPLAENIVFRRVRR